MRESQRNRDETYSVDKFGDVCAHRTSECARALNRRTDAFEVIVHDAETGRIGYVSKRTVVNDRVLDVAREFGYEVNLISATSYKQWDGEIRKAAGIEFTPVPVGDEDFEMEWLLAELEEDIEETEVSVDE